MRERFRRLLSPASRPTSDPTLGGAPVDGRARVVALCHPEWRGIRSATKALGLPMVEASDLDRQGSTVGAILDALGTEMVVVSGFPPGTERFVLAQSPRRRFRILMHSSMAQHGAEAGESAVIGTIARLSASGHVEHLGFTKEGQAEALSALGVPAVFVPAAIEELEEVARDDLGPGGHIGVFAEASWRKNVVTQLGAVALMGETAHVTRIPPVDYLPGRLRVVEHGLIDRDRFVRLVASVDLNLAVSLYECFPLLPQESYWFGVPALLSRTTALFADDEVLGRFSFVSEHDNPAAVARAASTLLERAEREGIVQRARAWMRAWNLRTADRREAFLDPDAQPGSTTAS